MAADDPLSVHPTLTGTTAERKCVGVAGQRLIGFDVTNYGATRIYFTYLLADANPTTAVAKAAGTIDVGPNGASTYVPCEDVYVNGQPEGVEFISISVVGATPGDNEYSFRGVRA